MSTKLKALGLAVMAAFAMGAIIASSASAQTVQGEFEGGGTGTVTATSQTDVFTAGTDSQITCPHTSFQGTFTSPTKTLQVVPTYSTNCTAFGIAFSHITVSGCAFEFTLNNTHSESLTKSNAKTRLECGPSAEGSIKVTPTIPIFGGSSCSVHFFEQDVTGNVDIKVDTAPVPDDLTVGPNNLGNAHGTSGGTPRGITYTVTNNVLGCPNNGNYHNGAYDLKQTTMQAYNNPAHTSGVGSKLVTK